MSCVVNHNQLQQAQQVTRRASPPNHAPAPAHEQSSLKHCSATPFNAGRIGCAGHRGRLESAGCDPHARQRLLSPAYTHVCGTSDTLDTLRQPEQGLAVTHAIPLSSYGP